MKNMEHAAGQAGGIGQASPDDTEVLPGTTAEGPRVPGKTPRAHAEEAIAESERAQYWHLFEFAPVGYVVTDANGTVRRANRAAARMLNTRAQLLRGTPLELLVAPEERGTFRRALGRLLATGGAQEWPMRLQPPHRAAVEVTMTVEAVRDGSGASRLYWIIRDDSERLEGDLL